MKKVGERAGGITGKVENGDEDGEVYRWTVKRTPAQEMGC